MIGLRAPKPRTARRGRRSGGTWNARPLQFRAGTGGQIFVGMEANVLFGKALGLGSGWKVVKSEMDVGRELKIWLDFRVRLSICLPAMRKVLSTRDRYACDDPCLGTQKVYCGKKSIP